MRKIKKVVILLLPPCKANKFFKLVLSQMKSSCQSQKQNSLRAFFIESNIILKTLQWSLQWSLLPCFTFKILFHFLFFFRFSSEFEPHLSKAKFQSISGIQKDAKKNSFGMLLGFLFVFCVFFVGLFVCFGGSSLLVCWGFFFLYS